MSDQPVACGSLDQIDQPAAIRALSHHGMSVWLDDLSRDMLTSGQLAELVRSRGVAGVTTNPTIFASSIQSSSSYDLQLETMAGVGLTREAVAFRLMVDDVRAACDVLRPVFDATAGRDGWVSLEVSPELAYDSEATIAAARDLWATVERPNVMIKIPATYEGLTAIRAAISEGININATLIFGLERYRAVMYSFMLSLEAAHFRGLDLSSIRSVASIFVSRFDTEVDQRLVEIDSAQAHALLGMAGLANARLAYEAWETMTLSPRWRALHLLGANVQRPLWASTGVKSASYPPTRYVTELVAPGAVNTMPLPTLGALVGYSEPMPDTIRGTTEESAGVWTALARLGIPYSDVVAHLENEAVARFRSSWADLLATVGLGLARSGARERAAAPSHS